MKKTTKKQKTHSLNEDKNRYQHLELQPFQTQMLRRQHKNTINNSQDNKSPLEPSNPYTAGLEYCNIAEAREIELKIASMNIIEILKEEMNKTLKICMKT